MNMHLQATQIYAKSGKKRTKVGRQTRFKRFIGKRENLVFNYLAYFEPM
jgi:hypothetical protein